MVNPYPPASTGTTVRHAGADGPGRGTWWGVGVIVLAVVVAAAFGIATNGGDDVARHVVEAQAGWGPVARRVDEVDGRAVVTVVSRAGGRRVAYSVVDGAPVGAPQGARRVDGAAPAVLAFETGGRTAVMATRGGHSVVLSAVGVPLSVLVRAARTMPRDG